MDAFAAVVLAGGAARRMGGVDKPALVVAGRPMLARVLAAVADAEPRVVVGPVAAGLPAGVLVTREDPPGGGPVAATAAGLALVDPDVAQVALLAADLPLLTAGAVAALRAAAAGPEVDVALYRDADGRRQLLCGVWRAAALRSALERLRRSRAAPGHTADRNTRSAGGQRHGSGGAGHRADGLAGAPVRALLDGSRVAELTWARPGPPPWFDCDTDADMRRAEEWAR